jgi:hypothetical protein
MPAMTEDNFERSLRAFRQRKPFKPFLVELASGTQIVIHHPEALAHHGRAAVYINPDGEFTLLDNTMVTQVSDITGNGTRGSRKHS